MQNGPIADLIVFSSSGGFNSVIFLYRATAILQNRTCSKMNLLSRKRKMARNQDVHAIIVVRYTA